jgi:OmpA-OmpF porin, OOP family
MRNRLYWFFSCLVAASFMLVTSTTGVAQGQKLMLQGIIAGRSGEDVTLHTDSGDKTVTLMDGTKVGSASGPFGISRGHEGEAALVPGLRVQVKGHDSGEGKVIADDIRFSGRDLKTAYDIQAGLTPTTQHLDMTDKQVDTNKQDIQDNKQQIQSTEQQTQSNQQEIQTNQQQIQSAQKQEQTDVSALGNRFDELADYDVKNETTIHFSVNSARLSAQDKSDLQALAAFASNTKGYLIQVAGYADSTGSTGWNQQLSDRRAEAVVNYLQQECNVNVSRVLAPAAMGVSQPVASNKTAEGRQENRRVDVKVLVNRGVSQGYTTTASLP